MHNYIKYLIILFSLGPGFTALNAQPGLDWSRDFFCELDNGSWNFVTKPIFDDQGNIYLAGSLLVDQNYLNRAPVVIKLNPQGDLIWQYVHPRYGYTPDDPPASNGNCAFTDLTFDHEGNLAAAGIAPFDTTVFGNKPFVVKLNSDGQMQWEKIMFTDISTVNYFGNSVTTDAEGNVYLTSLRYLNHLNSPGYLWKFNASGEQQWLYEFTYGAIYKSYIYHLEYLPLSNSILVAGDVELTSSYWIPFISKHNISTGAQIVEKRFSTNPTSYLEALYIDEAENVYVSLYSDDGKALVRKFDTQMEEAFAISYYPEASYDNNFGSIISLSDGNLLAAGYSYASSDSKTGRAVFLKFNPDGVALDTLVMDASGEEYFYDVAELDGELFFTGATTNNNDETALKLWRTDMQGTILGTHVYEKPGVNWSEGLWLHTNEDYVYATGTVWKDNRSGISVMKTSAQTLNSVSGIKHIDQHIMIYPNPATDYIHITSDAGIQNGTFIIYDQLGRIVKTGNINADNEYIAVNDLTNGLYLLSIESGSMILKGRFLKHGL